MANDKTLIDGTAYTITGGKTLIGGTAKTISGGKTLIGGTAKTITFRPPMTLKGLFTHKNTVLTAGRNASTSGAVAITGFTSTQAYQAQPWYLFSFCYGYMGIYKLKFASGGAQPTVTTIKASTSTSYGNFISSISNLNYTFTYSNNGTSATNVYGGTLLLMNFSDYTEAEVDALLSGVTYTRVTGRNSSSTGAIRANASSYANGKYVFMAYNNYVGLTHWTSATAFETIFGNHATNAGLVFRNSSYCQLSVNGTSAQSAYGASYLTAPY